MKRNFAIALGGLVAIVSCARTAQVFSRRRRSRGDACDPQLSPRGNDVQRTDQSNARDGNEP